MKKKFLSVFFVFVFSSLLFSAEKGNLAQIREKGKIVVGMASDYAPFEYKGKDGKIIGFDVDIAKSLANAMHVKLELKEYKWDDLIPALKKGEINIIISGITKTLDRALEVSFSDPYFKTGQATMLSNKNKGIQSIDELNKGDMKIAVLSGATGEQTVMTKIPKAKMVKFKVVDEASTALLKGDVDAFVYDQPYVDVFTKKNPEIDTVFGQLTYEYYCFAVAQGDYDFIGWLNYYLSELKSSGEYNNIYQYWFVNEEWKK